MILKSLIKTKILKISMFASDIEPAKGGDFFLFLGKYSKYYIIGP
jgi:hypothetical protein